MNDLTTSPFDEQRGDGPMIAGTRQMQARENTEVMAMAVMAKRYPRDMILATDRIRNAFTRTTLAERAQYQFARGGNDIVGPSIRAAEAMAQQWGNISSGWREVSRTVGPDGVGLSEVEAYCIDYEAMNRESIQFVVRHWRDTKRGGYALKDERDIYELTANQAQRRKRACILAQIPGDVTEMAMDQASVTLKAKADTSPEGVAKMLEAFAPFGVTKEHVEKRIQRRLDTITAMQMVQLKRIYASLRDDMSTPAEWFDITPPEPVSTQVENVKAALKRGKGPRAADSTAVEHAMVDDEPPPAKTVAKYMDEIMQSTDAEVAGLVLDEARSVLTEWQHAELVAVYRHKFPTTSEE